jgi:hypothetical protein
MKCADGSQVIPKLTVACPGHSRLSPFRNASPVLQQRASQCGRQAHHVVIFFHRVYFCEPRSRVSLAIVEDLDELPNLDMLIHITTWPTLLSIITQCAANVSEHRNFLYMKHRNAFFNTHAVPGLLRGRAQSWRPTL